MIAPSPFDTRYGAALDHDAFFTDTFGPAQLSVPGSGPLDSDTDTGLRCWCGREVVSTIGEPPGALTGTGWAHVGIGDRSDPA